MGSENKMNEGTSFHQSDKPILCANGCRFFGSAATMNLCSKCYRDLRLKEQQASSAIAAVEKSMGSAPSVPPPFTLVVDHKPHAVTAVQPPSTAAAAAPEKPPANRCMSCNKKVGLMGFKCKCGSTFCGSHRYPGQGHDCNFDYKGAGKSAIEKANPVIKADKIQRF